jgi:hypothetical protein
MMSLFFNNGNLLRCEGCCQAGLRCGGDQEVPFTGNKEMLCVV